MQKILIHCKIGTSRHQFSRQKNSQVTVTAKRCNFSEVTLQDNNKWNTAMSQLFLETNNYCQSLTEKFIFLTASIIIYLLHFWEIFPYKKKSVWLILSGFSWKIFVSNTQNVTASWFLYSLGGRRGKPASVSSKVLQHQGLVGQTAESHTSQGHRENRPTCDRIRHEDKAFHW